MTELLKDPKYKTSYSKLISTDIIELLFMVIAFTYNIWLMQMIVYMTIWFKVVLACFSVYNNYNNGFEKVFDGVVKSYKTIPRSPKWFITIGTILYMCFFLYFTMNIPMFVVYLISQAILIDQYQQFFNYVDTLYTNKVRLDKVTEIPNL